MCHQNQNPKNPESGEQDRATINAGGGMRLQRLQIVLLTVFSLGISGCALLLVGAGAVGGYAISRDSVRNVFDVPQDRVYEKSLAVAKSMGMVKLEDHFHGIIKADIQDANVTITVKQLTKKTVELMVRGRSHFFLPKVDVAQEVYSKIVEGL